MAMELRGCVAPSEPVLMISTGRLFQQRDAARKNFDVVDGITGTG